MSVPKKENSENPMAYFGNGKSKKTVMVRKRTTMADRIQKIIDNTIGLGGVKDFLVERQKMETLNAKKRKLGMSVFSRGSLLVLSGGGDGTAATQALVDYYAVTQAISNKKFQYLDLEETPNYWQESVRSTFRQALDHAKDTVLVVHGLGGLLDSTSEGAAYALEFFTKLMGQIDFDDRPVILLASQSEMKRWHAQNSGLKYFKTRIIPLPKYSPDDLVAQFVRHARADGYAIAPYVQTRIRDVFSVVQSPIFKKVSTYDLATKIYITCQDRQMQRMMNLPDEMQTSRRFRAFKKEDLVKFIAPCDRDVIIV